MRADADVRYRHTPYECCREIRRFDIDAPINGVKHTDSTRPGLERFSRRQPTGVIAQRVAVRRYRCLYTNAFNYIIPDAASTTVRVLSRCSSIRDSVYVTSSHRPHRSFKRRPSSRDDVMV